MKKYEHSDEIADALHCRWTPGNAGVSDASLMERKEVWVKRQYNTPFRCCESKLVGVRELASSHFLRRQNVDAAVPQALYNRAREMLVGEELIASIT